MAANTKPKRASSAPHGRFARGTTAPGRRGGMPRRRPRPEPTGVKKLVRRLRPAAAAKTATPKSRKGVAGGFALAAAAGMAFKNRDKLSKLRRNRPETRVTESEAPATPPATTGEATSPGH
jgi:hypothetical protein